MSNRVTGKGLAWERKKTLWMTIVTALFFGWIPFLYMGIKTKQRKWIIEAIIYCTILHVGAFLNGLDVVKSNEALRSANSFVMAFGWIASIVRYFMVKKEYLMRLAALEDVQPDRDADLRRQIQAEYAPSNNTPSRQTIPVDTTSQVPQGNPQASQMASENPAAISSIQEFANSYREKQVADQGHSQEPVAQTPSVQPQQTVQPVGTSQTQATQPNNSADALNPSATTDKIEGQTHVDINSCDANDLSKLPGISVPMARKAIAHRDEIGGYQSLDDFYTFLNLKPHIISQVSDSIICGAPTGGAKQRGRILDL